MGRGRNANYKLNATYSQWTHLQKLGQSQLLDDKIELFHITKSMLSGSRALSKHNHEVVMNLLKHACSYVATKYCSALKYEEALKYCDEAEPIIKDDELLLFNKGHLLRVLHRIPESLKYLKKCHELFPDDIPAVVDMVSIYNIDKLFAESRALLLEATKKHPDDFNLISELVVCHAKCGRMDKAVALANETLANPMCPMRIQGNIFCNIGNAFSDLSNVDDCLKYSAMAWDRDPSNIISRQNYLLNSLYKADRTRNYAHTTLFKHLQLGGQIKMAKNMHPRKLHTNQHEKIRIGYVTADLFNGHPMQYFARPLLRDFDRSRFDVYVYSNAAIITDKKDMFYVDYGNDVIWRNIMYMNDDQAADKVVEDEIDVLVDLSAHTAKNRVGLFSERLAPLVFCYLGYPAFTGMPDTDFILLDETFGNPHKTLSRPHDKSGKPYKMRYMHNTCFTCYVPLSEATIRATEETMLYGPRRDAPKKSYFTFGTLNKPSKLGQDIVDEWSGHLLEEFPDGLLCVRIDRVHRYSNVDQLLFLQGQKSFLGHLGRYSLLDMCLDTAPYSGTTTTCEALFMGTPVITVPDRIRGTVQQNVSASILRYSGMEKFIAKSQEDVPRIMREILADIDAMGSEEYKKSIRKKFLEGDVCDVKRYMDEYQRVVIEEFNLKKATSY